MPVQTRSMRRREEERIASLASPSSTRFNPLTPSFVPSQRPGEDTQSYHSREAIEAREVSRRYGIRRQERTETLNADISSDRLDAVKEILDTNVSDLYSRLLNNDAIYNILNQNQLFYLRNDRILSNYYYRRLEFNYIVDIVEKFNLLTDLINIDKNSITDDNRYDINYYYEIKKIIASITDDYKILFNKSTWLANNLKDIQLKISNEKVILNELIRTLIINIERITDNDIERKRIYEEFKTVLEERLEKLNGIREQQLKALLKNDATYQTNRENLMKIIKSAFFLASTFKILIINIGILRNLNDIHMKDLIIDDMIDAVEYYMNTINSSNDSSGYQVSLDLQISLYNDLDGLLEGDDFRNYIRDVNQYIHEQSIDTDYSERILEAAQERLRRERISIINNRELTIRRENLRIQREETRREARQARQEAIRVARQARQEAIRVAREARQQAIRDARRVAREARPVRRVQPSNRISILRVPPATQVISIKFEENDFEKDESVEMKFDTTFQDITDSNYAVFLNTVRDKYIKRQFKIKKELKYKIDENYKKMSIKYKTLFNLTELRLAVSIPSIKNYVGNSIISLFIRYMKFNGDMKFNDTSRYYVFNINLLKDDNNVFSEERQTGIDAGGLRRDFITSLTTELFDKKIFINRDDSRYFLNSDFEPDEFMKYIIKNNYKRDADDDYYKNEFIIEFYKFLGNLISFIFVNNCGLEKYLSSYLTSLFLKNNQDFDDEDYVSFMASDMPTELSMITNLMKKPDDIEYIGSTYNDYYLLDERTDEGDELNKDNIVDYLKKTAKFMMTTSILRKDIEIRTGRDYREIFEKGKRINYFFIQGIPMALRDECKENNFRETVINSYLKNPDMTDDIINKLINNFKSTMQTTHNYRINPLLQKLSLLFLRYVLRNTEGKHANEEAYHKFIINLLKFWSGSSFYKDSERYKIAINPGLSFRHLPQSHTCFFMIDLPPYIGTDEEIGELLFNKIEMAISNVESGIGLAGGGRSRRRKTIHNKINKNKDL